MKGQFLSGRESSLTFVLSLNEYINIETSQFLFLQTFDLALSLIWRKRRNSRCSHTQQFFFYQARKNGENKNDNVRQNMIPW